MQIVLGVRELWYIVSTKDHIDLGYHATCSNLTNPKVSNSSDSLSDNGQQNGSIFIINTFENNHLVQNNTL